MADRYRGGEHERPGRRGGGPHRDDFGSRDLGRTDYTDTANRRYGPSFGDRSDIGREENYFGTGRMGYGDGMEDVEPNRSFGSSWRDSTGYSNYENPDQRYDSTRRRAGFGRDAFGLGYGGDWEPEANRRRYENRDLDRNRYEESYAADRGNWLNRRDYPSSERGFYGGRNESERKNRSWWDRASDEVSSWFGGDTDRDRYNDRYSGGFRGRGPKNYTRSDDRIRDDINDRLTDNDYLDASDIDVAVKGGEVTLTGFVDSRYSKRTAEDIADDISGVKNVENRLRIREQQTSDEFGYADTTGHTDLNQTETAATHTEKGTARGKTTSG
jgi:osmotically-inducible protein OsmY